MKTKRLLMFMAFFGISATLLLSACKKDKTDDKPAENILEKSYFVADKGIYQSEAFPAMSTATSAPSITGLYGNVSILQGGSNPISIESSSNIKDILVGVKDVGGYYAVPASAMKSTDVTNLLILLFSQEIEMESFVIVIALRDHNGLVSPHETITVSKITAGTGILQVSCSWDKPDDVDLYLREPNGSQIYYGNDESENGGLLDVDSNAACSIDNINNENITYSSTSIVEGGTYTVLVDLWSNCQVEENTNYSVIAIYKGAVIAASSGSNPFVGAFAWEDCNNYEPTQVMTFQIPVSKAQPTDAKALKFVYSKRNLVKSPQKMN